MPPINGMRTDEVHPAAEVRVVEATDRQGQGRDNDCQEPDGCQDEPDHIGGAGDAGAVGAQFCAGRATGKHDDVQDDRDESGDEHPPPVFAPAGAAGERPVLLEEPRRGLWQGSAVERCPEWHRARIPEPGTPQRRTGSAPTPGSAGAARWATSAGRCLAENDADLTCDAPSLVWRVDPGGSGDVGRGGIAEVWRLARRGLDMGLGTLGSAALRVVDLEAVTARDDGAWTAAE